MEKGTFNPSRCEIKEAELIPFNKENKRTYDISVMVTSFQINQAINLSALTGTLDVYDGSGLLQNVPLRGEEELRLTIFCYDLQTEVSLNCQVYKISNVETRKDQKGVVYTLDWITKTTYEASKRSIIKAFDKKASTIVKDIFQQYYSQLQLAGPKENEYLPPNTEVYEIVSDRNRRFYLEKTDDRMHVTIPDYTPAQAIKFIAKRAFGSSRSKSSSYRFFETFNGYYFVSDEWLYEYGVGNSKKKLTYGAFVELDSASTVEQINTLTEFGNPLRVDVGAEMGDGAYYNTVVEIDILKRTAKRFDYNYIDYQKEFIDSTGKKAALGQDVHTKEFIKETFTPENAKQFMIVRDYKDTHAKFAYRPENNFRDMVSKRAFYTNHAARTVVGGLTSGRLDLLPGEIIRIIVREMNAGDQSQENRQLSGRYLLTGIESSVVDGQLTSAMSLMKYDWSDAASDERSIS